MSMQYEAIAQKIQDLQEKLLTSHPQMPILLREIHSTLKQNPDCVTLLTEDEIAIVVQGLSKQTMTHLSGSIMKSTKSASATKKLKTVSTDDLGF